MAFSRTLLPGPRPDADQLTADMVGIGMRFAAAPNRHANIEDTLIHASEVGMGEDDLRVLSVLTTWFGVHHARVNADRLVRVLEQHPSRRVRAYWASIAAWQEKDRRLKRLVVGHEGEPVDLLSVGTDFQILRRGEDERFAGTAVRVPAGTLRDRAADVLSAELLIRQHAGYRNRVHMGPSWRSDLWTLLERDPDLRVAELARRAYCSFATAWQVAQDFGLIRRAQEETRVA